MVPWSAGTRFQPFAQVRAVNGAGLLSDTESFLVKRVSLKTPTRDRVLLKEYVGPLAQYRPRDHLAAAALAP